MKMRWVLALGLLLPPVAPCQEQEAPAGTPGPEVEAGAPATVEGAVFLDANGNGALDAGEKGLPGIRVTDSVDFTATGEDGAYRITIAADPQIPYKPSRVVSASWPSGKWPTGAWWRRLSEIKPGERVNFGLRDEEQKLPFLFVHITDDHGNGGLYPGMGELVRQQLMSQARFCFNTGDMGYAGPDSADAMFGGIRTRADAFPVPMFFAIGNHDIAHDQANPSDWSKGPLHGYGGFTKHLGPVRWSFSYGGVHFAAIDWADLRNNSFESVPEIAAEWLDRDLQALPPGTRTFLMVHFPNGCQRYYDVIAKHKVLRIFGGHNHTTRDYYDFGPRATTGINLCGTGANLGIVQESDFCVVNYCGGCKGVDYHNKRCALKEFLLTLTAPIEQRNSAVGALLQRQAKQAEAAARTVSSATEALDAGPGGAYMVAEIDPGTAKRVGLRLGGQDPLEVVHDGHTLTVAGVPIPYTLRPHEKTLSWQLAVDGGQLVFYANKLIRLEKAVATKDPARVTLFAEGGTATFTKVTVTALKP